MNRAPSKAPGAPLRWRKVGGVSHRFRWRRGKWRSLCDFFDLDQVLGHSAGRPGRLACSLCRVAGRPRGYTLDELLRSLGAGRG